MKAQFDESNRFIFYKKRDSFFGNLCDRFRVHIIYALIGVLILCILSYGATLYAHIRYQDGIQQGIKQALDTRQPTEELEIACAGLWIGEQNKRYFKK